MGVLRTAGTVLRPGDGGAYTLPSRRQWLPRRRNQLRISRKGEVIFHDQEFITFVSCSCSAAISGV